MQDAHRATHAINSGRDEARIREEQTRDFQNKTQPTHIGEASNKRPACSPFLKVLGIVDDSGVIAQQRQAEDLLWVDGRRKIGRGLHEGCAEDERYEEDALRRGD
jgi:hypothetical protein